MMPVVILVQSDSATGSQERLDGTILDGTKGWFWTPSSTSRNDSAWWCRRRSVLSILPSDTGWSCGHF